MKKIYVWVSFLLIGYIIAAVAIPIFSNANLGMNYGLTNNVFTSLITDFIIGMVAGIGVGVLASLASLRQVSPEKVAAYTFFTGTFYAIWDLGTSMITDVAKNIAETMATSPVAAGTAPASFDIGLILNLIGIFVYAIAIAAIMGGDVEGY